MDVNVLANMRKTCRTCMRVHESRKELISIFDFDQTLKKVNFSEMLAAVSNHKVYENDSLPKKICVICLQQIRGAFFFKTQAENSFNVLSRQIGSNASTLPSGVKQETSTGQTTNKQSNLPLIVAPRTINKTYSEDMLVEVEPPRLQEHFGGHDEEEEESDDTEFIDYEPNLSDNEPIITIEESQSSEEPRNDKGTSPDSGINDDSERALAFENQKFHEQQMEVSETEEFTNLQCKFCQKQMISVQALIRHTKTFHNDFKCAYCSKKVGNDTQMKLHIKFKHPHKYNEYRLNGQINPVVQVETIAKIPECDSCNTKFADMEALHRHHADCDQKCINCNIAFNKKSDYLNHLENRHNIKLVRIASFECPFGCKYNFQSEKHLLNHVQCSHPDEKDCESIADTISEDGDSVSTEASSVNTKINKARLSLQTQLLQARIRTRRNSIGCPIRSIPKDIKSLVKFHPSIQKAGLSLLRAVPTVVKQNPGPSKEPTVVTKAKKLTTFTREEFCDRFVVKRNSEYLFCLPCQKELGRKSLSVHLKSKHAAVLSFRCELCPEAFPRQDYRQRHMGYCHLNQMTCSHCRIQFDRIYKYDMHMQLHHNVKAKNFKPSELEDKFDLPMNNLKYVEDITTYDYTVADPSKRMSIASSSSIQSEIPISKDAFIEKYLVQLSDKFSHCTVCQQRVTKRNIISHMLWKHAVQKPLKCAFCNDRVIKNSARIAHMARCHPNEYKCNNCDAQFVKHDVFAHHMLNVHNRKLTSLPSSGEEEDIPTHEIKFVSQRDEDEEIEDAETFEIDEEDEIVNQPIVNEVDSYRCTYCSKSFASAKNMQLHKSHKHKAEMCKAATRNHQESSSEAMTVTEFRKNHVQEIDDNDVKCLICDQTMRRKNFGAHLKARHATTGAFKCALCTEDFYRPEQRIQHMSQSHRGIFYCSTCGIQFYRNSRFAKHMLDMHDVQVESNDTEEVDLNLDELLYVAHIRRSGDESAIAEPTAQQDQDTDQVPKLMTKGAVNREVFLSNYIKNVGKENRRCMACEKTINKGSLYNHMIRYHAETLPLKCPFCEIRFERAAHRMKHLQVYHPNEYKCNECGLQFQKYGQFTEHMLTEHNFHVKSKKPLGEEKDLSTFDIMYVKRRPAEDQEWQEEDSSFTTELEASTSSQNHSFLKPRIKEEPEDNNSHLSIMHSIFGDEQSLVEEMQTYKEQFSYNDFKSHFIREVDNLNFLCVPCQSTIPKTSTAAHLRLWHASTACFVCEVCSEGFKRQDYRQRHMKACHPNDQYCGKCEVQFHRSTLYKEHMLEFHNVLLKLPERMTKDEIDVPLEKLKFLEKIEVDHENTKRGGRPRNQLKPINPEAGGLTYKEFQEQYVEVTGEHSYVCKICSLTMSKFAIKKHMKRVHATSKPFYCELCPEGFQRPDTRTSHMAQMHKDDFKCFECNIQFYMSSNFTEHMQLTHDKEVRTISFKSKTDIDVPIERLRFVPEILENEDPELKELKPPKKTFDDISDDIELTRQQFFGKFYRTIKGGEVPRTKCLACLKIFSTKNRQFHALFNHATFRPLKCELCETKFHSGNKRIFHMSRCHTEDYKCSICQFVQFDRAQHYANHMLNDHQITIPVPKFNEAEINIPPENMRYTKKVTSVRRLKAQERYALKTAGVDLETSFQTLDNGTQKCNECGEEFESARAMRTHLRNHLNGFATQATVGPSTSKEFIEILHNCDLCDKKFRSLHALNAHKKFKYHNEDEVKTERSKKPKAEKKPIGAKYIVDCDICDFNSPRRDYVEHHVRQVHKTEFQCSYCTRVLSNYNMYMFHVHTNHPNAKESIQRNHMCDECGKGFRQFENLNEHKEKKHATNSQLPDHYCTICYVNYFTKTGLEGHFENIYHQKLQKFIDKQSAIGDFSETTSQSEDKVRIKDEPMDEDSIMVETLSISTQEEEDTNESDPFQRMLERQLFSEPPEKRIRLSTPTAKAAEPTSDDKLDYLKYLQTHEGGFKCGVCGIVKPSRKYMLRHLKDHDEIPTFKCTVCTEKFVFKKKFEEHMKTHPAPAMKEVFQSEELDVLAHPKFQNVDKNEIKCHICEISFKLTIMLNRHNSLWHSEENPLKDLSSNDQKMKKNEPQSEISVIKLLKCKFCEEAFIKPLELENHLKEKHEDDQTTESQAAKSGGFNCDQCKLQFAEKQFLENHQTYFCISRPQKSDQVVIEQ